ncbi:MAG: hypothetical protein ACXVKN_10920 [Acidimicrobiia bacterium]
MSTFNAVMFPAVLTHTEPLNFPGTFIPLLSAVTAPENLKAVGSVGAGPVFGGFTYPGHFVAFVATSAATPKVLVFPLTHVTVPPTANDAVGSGMEAPPVLPVPLHPLMVTVPVAVPVTVVQVIFPLGPAAHA